MVSGEWLMMSYDIYLLFSFFLFSAPRNPKHEVDDVGLPIPFPFPFTSPFPFLSSLSLSLGPPPPLFFWTNEQQVESSTDVIFLIGAYTRYKCPYVWVYIPSPPLLSLPLPPFVDPNE